MRLTSLALALAWLALAATCTSQHAAAPTSPTPSPIPSPVFSSPSPPAPEQRMEAPLPASIEETAAAAAGGRLYVMGGFNAAGASLDGVYVFDGTSWSTGPRLRLPLDHASAATLNGAVYIAGGHSNGHDSARLFRLDGDQWTELAPMHYPRGGHALVADEGELYAIGGNNAAGNVGPEEAYDPATNAWTVVGLLPQARNHVSGFVVGAAACVGGGRSPTTARVDCFDVTQQAWFRLPDLPRATSGAGAATFAGGGVLLLGGQNAGETAIVDQLTRYRPGAGWSAPEAMLVPRHGFELAMFQGRAWACGGGVAPGLRPVATCTSIGNGLPSTSNRGK